MMVMNEKRVIVKQKREGRQGETSCGIIERLLCVHLGRNMYSTVKMKSVLPARFDGGEERPRRRVEKVRIFSREK